MGMLSSALIAPKADAKLMAESTAPAQKWQGVDWKSVDHIKFCTLCVILDGGKLPDVPAVQARINQMELLHQVSENGPWVFLIPRALRDLMAGCSTVEDYKVKSIAEAWGASEEFSSWKAEDVFKLLEDITGLADTARLEDKELMLWLSM